MANTQTSSQSTSVPGNAASLPVPGASSTPASSLTDPSAAGSSDRPRTPGMTREELAEKRAAEQLRQSKLLSNKASNLSPSGDGEAAPRTSFSDDIGKAFDNIGQAHNQPPPAPEPVAAPPSASTQQNAAAPSSNGNGAAGTLGKGVSAPSAAPDATASSSLSAKPAPVRNTSTPVPNFTSVTLDGTPVFFIDDGAKLPAELAGSGAGTQSSLARGGTPVNAGAAVDSDITPKAAREGVDGVSSSADVGGGRRRSVDETPAINVAGAVPATDIGEQPSAAGQDEVREPSHEDRTLSSAVGAGSQPVELAPITEVGSNASQAPPIGDVPSDRNLVPPPVGATGKLAAGAAGAAAGGPMSTASNTRMGAERAASATSIVAIKGGCEGRGHTRTESAGTVGTAGSQDTAIPPGTPIQTHSTASLGIGIDTKRGFDPAASDASIVAIRAGMEGNTPSPQSQSPLGLSQSFSAADAASDRSRSIATPRSGETGELPQISEHSGHDSEDATRGPAAGATGGAALAAGGAALAARHRSHEDGAETTAVAQDRLPAAAQGDVEPEGITPTATRDGATDAGAGVPASSEAAEQITHDPVMERHASDATGKAAVRTTSAEPPSSASMTEDGVSATGTGADTPQDIAELTPSTRPHTAASSTRDIPGAWVNTPGSESKDALGDAPNVPDAHGTESPALNAHTAPGAESSVAPGDDTDATPVTAPGATVAKDHDVDVKDLATTNGPVINDGDAAHHPDAKVQTPSAEATLPTGTAAASPGATSSPEKVREASHAGWNSDDRAALGKSDSAASPAVPSKDAPTTSAAAKGATGSSAPIADKDSREATPARPPAATPESKGHTRNSSKSSTGSGRKKMGLLSKLKGEIRGISGKLQHGDKKE